MMNIDNSIKLAKVEGQLGEINALYKNNLISIDECEYRLATAVGQFRSLYDLGAIDSKFNYDLALSISSTVEELNVKCCENRSDAEIFWTMRNEAKAGEDFPDVEDILARSLKIQDDARLNEIRKEKELRVVVEGWRMCVDDDGNSTYNAETEFEIGEGANTIQEALAIVEKFQKETAETNQKHYDGFDILPGYYSHRLFTVYNPIREPLFAGFWQYEKQAYHVPGPLTDEAYHDLHDEKSSLNKELSVNQRADNYDSCRHLINRVSEIELRLLTSDFWTTVDDFPGDEVIGDYADSVKIFNAKSITASNMLAKSKIYAIYDELSDSCIIENKFEDAKKEMQRIKSYHEASGVDYDVFVYEIPADEAIKDINPYRLKKDYIDKTATAHLVLSSAAKLSVINTAGDHAEPDKVFTDVESSTVEHLSPVAKMANIKELFLPFTESGMDLAESKNEISKEEKMEGVLALHERAENRLRVS